MTTRTLTVSRLALAAVAGVVSLFANDNLSSTRESSLITQADAQVGRPLTPGSVAGVARRTERRAIRRGAVVGGATAGATADYGAGGYGTLGVARRTERRAIRRDAVVGGAAVGATADYGAGGYRTFGAASASGYGPGPVEGSVIVNPNTGRWCTFEQSGWRWCWTP
jgi:hypothetical protein